MNPGKEHNYAYKRNNCVYIAKGQQKWFEIKGFFAAWAKGKDDGSEGIKVDGQGYIVKHHKIQNIGAKEGKGDGKTDEPAVYGAESKSVCTQVIFAHAEYESAQQIT